MKYYMVKVIKRYGGRWELRTGINYAGWRYFVINTLWGGLGFVFSSGNGHYLREPTKQEYQNIKKFENMPDDIKYPKRKNGEPDMRYKINKPIIS